MIIVKEVTTKKQIKEFLDFPLNLYNGNKYFVPPIYSDEKKIFSKDYVYSDTCKTVFYNAYQDNKIVGRISAIIQNASNEKWDQKRVRFTRFDSIDSQDVADSLFNKVEEFAKENGMTEIVGPLGYSDLEREGLLIEGFDYLNTYEEQYNYPYYQKLIENNGYEKEVDWIEHRLMPVKEKSERLISLGDKILEHYKLKIVTGLTPKQYIKKYKDQFFDILDLTYDKIYGTVPFTDSMKQMMIDNFQLIINMNLFITIVDENDKIAAFALAFPAIGEALQKSKGHFTLPCIFKLLKAIKHPKQMDLGLIGVLPEYESKGVAASMIGRIITTMLDNNIEYAETNLNLEDNKHIINQWKNFDYIQHKRRRCFIKKI